MKEKRYLRAFVVALAAASFGLLCCMGVFFLLRGETTAGRLFPWLLFFAVAVAAALLRRVFGKSG